MLNNNKFSQTLTIALHSKNLIFPVNLPNIYQYHLTKSLISTFKDT